MKRTRIPLYLILLPFLALLITLILPVSKTISSHNQISYDQTIPTLANGYHIIQPFVPQYDEIRTLELHVRTQGRDKTQGHLTVTLFDAARNVISENTISTAELREYGWQTVLTDLSVEAGTLYYLRLESFDTLDDGPMLSFFQNAVAASTEQIGQTLTYADVPMENTCLKMGLIYNAAPSLPERLVYWTFLSFILLTAATLWKRFFPENNK